MQFAKWPLDSSSSLWLGPGEPRLPPKSTNGFLPLLFAPVEDCTVALLKGQARCQAVLLKIEERHWL